MKTHGMFSWFMVLMVALFLTAPSFAADPAPTPTLTEQVTAAATKAATDAATAAAQAALKSINESNITQAVEASTANTKEIIGTLKDNAGKVVAVATTAAATTAATAATVKENAPGWGKEIGTMLKDAGVAFVSTVDSGLTVTQDHLIKFADSDAGKFTMFAIAWKLFARDFLEVGEVLMGYLVGGLLLIILSKVIWSVNRRLTHGSMVVKSQTGWGIFSKKTKEFVPAKMDNDEKTGVYVASLVAQIIVIIIGLVIMF
jgi:hypothetical protein